jgi:signal transduction histidine kinase/CheY-like chemotaxis protein
MRKISFAYFIIPLFTMLALAAYWIFDSFWSVTIYKANLRYLIHNPPLSLMDTLSFKVPPYQATNRIVVLMIILLLGLTALLTIYIRDKMMSKIRKAEEEQLRLSKLVQRAKRMETVGVMAAGVAHDLNNVLSGVTTYPEILLLNVDKKDPMHAALTSILEAGRKATNIVKDLSILSKGVMPHDQIVNINNLIHEFITSQALIQKLPTDRHVVISPRYTKEPIFVKGSETHLYKIVMNLVLNAINAIDDAEGLVEIKTSVVELTKPIENYPDIRKGKYVLLEVIDTGRGISEQDLDHVFEPFFTKYALGRNGGTGLGLTIVWASVHEHAGYLYVKSNDGGTRFMIYLPLEEDVFNAKGETKMIEKYKGHGEKILVVDDNKIQRHILQTLLTTLNYEVVTAHNGEEAVRVMQADKKFDLVILDVAMPPGMRGCATFQEMLKINPDQKAIIASGYMDSDKIASAMQLGIKHFIHKPYSIHHISEKIYNTLTNED